MSWRFRDNPSEARRAGMGNNKANISTLLAAAALIFQLSPPQRGIGDVIAALAKTGVFRLRGLLIGAIAHQTYAAMLGVRRSAGSRQTGDVDIAQFKMFRWLSTTQRRPFWTC
ncbi:GSU2403 family nucleotidyltransferase fold protein [Bradyrhizobium sp. USDA 4504]